MSPDALFVVANVLVVPGWLLLVFAPRWSAGPRLIAPVVIPGVLAVLYIVQLVAGLGGSSGDFGSLAGIRALFSSDAALLAGWIHYLAFDLFIGSWEVRDAERHDVPRLAVVPCLVLTFVAGPAGLLAYLVVRSRRVGRLRLGSGARRYGTRSA